LFCSEPDVEPQTERWPVEQGDIYVVCSDGVSNELPDDALRDLAANGSPSSAAWRIVNDALLSGGRDNATVIVVRVDSLDPH
jgi:protein phosphatase